MANPLPDERELYERIREEKIVIAPEIWNLLHHRIGDDITTINFLCNSCLNQDQAIPIEEAKKIFLYTRHIKDIVNQITLISKKDSPFPEFMDTLPLHPIIREMLTHYIGNDIHTINFMVQDTIDPIEPHPVPIEIIQKILAHTRSIKEFMERLRVATLQERRPAESEGASKNNYRHFTKEEILLKIRESLSEEFKIEGAKIQPSSRFREDLGLDSVDAIRVIMCIEEAFELEIPDEATDGILTVNQAVDYILAKLKRVS